MVCNPLRGEKVLRLIIPPGKIILNGLQVIFHFRSQHFSKIHGLVRLALTGKRFCRIDCTNGASPANDSTDYRTNDRPTTALISSLFESECLPWSFPGGVSS